MIQVSQQTADLIVSAGKGHWLRKRDELVHAKGKGELQTYWMKPRRLQPVHRPPILSVPTDITASQSTTPKTVEERGSEYRASDELNHRGAKDEIPTRSLLGLDSPSTKQWAYLSMDDINIDTTESKDDRLIDWNTEILYSFLAKLSSSRDTKFHTQPVRQIGRRSSMGSKRTLTTPTIVSASEQPSTFAGHVDTMYSMAHTEKAMNQDLPVVRSQLRTYVSEIAMLHHDQPFHNFEHASHVALAATKMLSCLSKPKRMERLPKDLEDQARSHDTNSRPEECVIRFDPLAQFVIVLAALVHDVAHEGFTNLQLAKVQGPIAWKCRNKSVAEQNAVDFALSILKRPAFRELQSCICPTFLDYQRFSKLLVNTVVRAAIAPDQDLQSSTNLKWDGALLNCAEEVSSMGSSTTNSNCPAHIVECIVQASDLAHRMQHWQIYTKWNARLLEEINIAYRDRPSDDPAERWAVEHWYEGELAFFDNHVIPLAKTMTTCGAFGTSLDEYLTYALENREEWARKGREITLKVLGTIPKRCVATMPVEQSC
jgi:hypothetical protein